MAGDNHYKGARALRTFEHLGETFAVVRWRDGNGKYWRGYTALLHDGCWVSDDIIRNSEDTWEVQLARMFRSREKLLESLRYFGGSRKRNSRRVLDEMKEAAQ